MCSDITVKSVTCCEDVFVGDAAHRGGEKDDD